MSVRSWRKENGRVRGGRKEGATGLGLAVCEEAVQGKGVAVGEVVGAVREMVGQFCAGVAVGKGGSMILIGKSANGCVAAD